MNKINDWWDALQLRERYMVLFAAMLVALSIIYLAIWSPIATNRDSKLKRVEAKRDTVVWMNQKKQEVEHFKSWLYTFVRNHCLMQLRREKRNLEISFEAYQP